MDDKAVENGRRLPFPQLVLPRRRFMADVQWHRDREGAGKGPTSMPRRPQRMLLLDLALAACLVSIEIVVVILWLLCFLLAVNHVLEPWTNAGLLLYGPGLVVLAAMVGVPGAAWAHRLSEELALPWSRRARAVARTGSMALALGGGVALVAWMVAIV